MSTGAPPLTPEALRALIAEEGDERRWTYRGIACHVLRYERGSGHWCGYVQIPDDHPWRHFSAPETEDLDVHGGLTGGGGHGEENESWIGFDCAHAGDLNPEYVLRDGLTTRRRRGYRTRAYAEGQCQLLADQVLAAADRVKVFAIGTDAQADFKPGEKLTIRTFEGSVTIDPKNAEYLAVVMDAWLMTLRGAK